MIVYGISKAGIVHRNQQPLAEPAPKPEGSAPRRHGKRVAVLVDGVPFPSLAEAARCIGVSQSAFRWHVVEKGECEIDGHAVEVPR